MENVPEWLNPQPQSQSNAVTLDQSKAVAALEIQTWEIAFETVLEKLAAGQTFDSICLEYHLELQPARFRSWIFRNPRRKEAYMTAKAIGAEAVEDELIRIADGLRADGTATMDDVPRSQLKIATRKWLLQVWNRKRYGESKHIEQTTTNTMTVDVRTMSTDDLKQFVLRQAGMGAEEGDFSPVDYNDEPQEET